MPGDHHSEYLAMAVGALTPEGRARIDELLDELVEAAGGRRSVIRFAEERRAEADLGRLEPSPAPSRDDTLTAEELDRLIAGFMAIRDQEHLDDVADWANAVVALLEDISPGTPPPRR